MAKPTDQFIVKPLVGNEDVVLSGINLTFTNSSLWMVLAALTSISFLSIAMHKKALIPGRLQIMAELMYEFVSKMVSDNIGPKGKQYFPFIFTMFFFVLFGNLLGLLPYSFTYTSHISVTATLAVTVMVMTIGFGILNNGLKFFSLFLPANVPWWLVPFIIPIEIISFFVRPVTHSVRLCANMMAGHLILKVVLSFAVGAASLGGAWVVLGIFPVLVDVAFLMFELLVAGVQAYVFAILSCVYLKDTVDLHH